MLKLGWSSRVIFTGLRGCFKLGIGFTLDCSLTSNSFLLLGGSISCLLGFLVLIRFWRGLVRLLTGWTFPLSQLSILCSMYPAWKLNWVLITYPFLSCLLSTLKASSHLSLLLCFSLDLFNFGRGTLLNYWSSGRVVQLKMPLGKIFFLFNNSFPILWARCFNGGKYVKTLVKWRAFRID